MRTGVTLASSHQDPRFNHVEELFPQHNPQTFQNQILFTTPKNEIRISSRGTTDYCDSQVISLKHFVYRNVRANFAKSKVLVIPSHCEVGTIDQLVRLA